MSAVCLLLALVLVFFGHRFTPYPWASFVSGLGFLLAVLLWVGRGPRLRPMWFVCVWGSFEALGTGVCQGLLNWIPQRDSPAVCDSMAGVSLTLVSLSAAALIVYRIAREAGYG